jgi:hypothetical protein
MKVFAINAELEDKHFKKKFTFSKMSNLSEIVPKGTYWKFTRKVNFNIKAFIFAY